MEIKCLECGKKVVQTPGKRKKEYCDSTCRTKYWKKSKDLALKQAGKVKKGRGRPKKEVQAPKTVIEGPIKEVLQEASKETAKLGVEAMINAIKAEKIPAHRDTLYGRKSWAIDQQKRIKELENQLK